MRDDATDCLRGRDARRRLSGTDPLARLFLADDELAHYVCGWMCEHRPTAARLVRLARPNLPKRLAEDRGQPQLGQLGPHRRQPPARRRCAEWLEQIRVPVWMLAGSDDRSLPLDLLRSLAERNARIKLLVVAGAGHDLPLSHPGDCIAALSAAEQEVLDVGPELQA